MLETGLVAVGTALALGLGDPAARPTLGLAPGETAGAVVNWTWGTVTTVLMVEKVLDAGIVAPPEGPLV